MDWKRTYSVHGVHPVQCHGVHISYLWSEVPRNTRGGYARVVKSVGWRGGIQYICIMYIKLPFVRRTATAAHPSSAYKQG